MKTRFVLATAIIGLSMIATAHAQPPENESDPEWRYVSASFAIQSTDDFVAGARDACAAVVPTLADENASAYAKWREDNASAFAELPTELDRAFAIVAEKDGTTAEQVRDGLRSRQQDGRTRTLKQLSSLSKADAHAQCATFPELLVKMSLKRNSDLRAELERLQEARARLFDENNP